MKMRATVLASVCLALLVVVALPATSEPPSKHAVLTLDDGTEITLFMADEVKVTAMNIQGDRVTGRAEFRGDVEVQITRNGVLVAKIRTQHAVLTRSVAQ